MMCWVIGVFTVTVIMATDRSHNPIVGHFHQVISCHKLCAIVKPLSCCKSACHRTMWSLKRLFTQKSKLCHYLLKNMTCFLLWNIREDTVRNVSVFQIHTVLHTQSYVSKKHKHAVLNYSYMLPILVLLLFYYAFIIIIFLFIFWCVKRLIHREIQLFYIRVIQLKFH